MASWRTLKPERVIKKLFENHGCFMLLFKRHKRPRLEKEKQTRGRSMKDDISECTVSTRTQSYRMLCSIRRQVVSAASSCEHGNS